MLEEPNTRQRLLSYPSLNKTNENADKSTSRFFSLSEGSLLGCISLVVASILGATMLRFPRSLKMGSIYFLLPYLALACAINLFACYALLKVANRTGFKTFYGIGSHLFGRGVGIFCEMVLVISCYNKILIYMIDISWTMSFISDKFKDLPEIFSNAIIWCLLIGIFIFYPQALFKEISKLRYAAKISFLAAVSLVIALLVYNIIHQPDMKKETTEEEDIIHFYSTFLADMMQAFVCQFNLLQIYEELEYKNVDKGMEMVKISFGIVSAIYLCYGALGYFMLSGLKCENEFIIGSNEIETVVTGLLVVIMILSKAHLRIFPCKEGVYSCLWPKEIYISRIKNLIVSTAIIFTAVAITALFNYPEWTGKSGIMYFYRIQDGFMYLIDLLACVIIPCIFYLETYRDMPEKRYLGLCVGIVCLALYLCLVKTILAWKKILDL